MAKSPDKVFEIFTAFCWGSLHQQTYVLSFSQKERSTDFTNVQLPDTFMKMLSHATLATSRADRNWLLCRRSDIEIFPLQDHSFCWNTPNKKKVLAISMFCTQTQIPSLFTVIIDAWHSFSRRWLGSLRRARKNRRGAQHHSMSLKLTLWRD